MRINSTISGIGTVVILDEFGRRHHLIAVQDNKVAALISPQHWTAAWGHPIFDWSAARWYYDAEKMQLRKFADRELCLTANPNSYTLHFTNCSSCNDNQAFVYNQEDREIFWINPNTNDQHPVYLEKDCCRHMKTIPMVSRNPISKSISDQIRRFADFRFMNAHKEERRKRALTLHSLQRSMPRLTSIEYQKYMEMVEGFNDAKFDYFMTEHNDYLIGDGHTVCTIKRKIVGDISYKYHGLWHVNEKNQLVHFLSGKYLQAIPKNASCNVKKMQKMIYSHKVLDALNDTYYDLKLSEYSKDIDHTFVTARKVWNLDGRHEMYIHNDRQAKKIQNTMIVYGADVLLAFTTKPTMQQVNEMMSIT